MKKDAETGNTIPYAGAGFQIYDPNGELVTMTYTYPEVTTIDTFYTTADGDLITPQTLEYGKGYSLVEVQAPYGYVLNSDPVYFDVVQEDSAEESGITVIEVVRENVAQKGTITVEKTGEIFSTVAGDKSRSGQRELPLRYTSSSVFPCQSGDGVENTSLPPRHRQGQKK